MPVRAPRLSPLAACIAVLLGAALCAQAQRRPPAAIPANYLGPTTPNTYQPLAPASQPAPDPIRVIPIPDSLRRSLRLNPFYTKTLTIRGIPIVASPKTSDYALLECAYTLDHMLQDSPASVLHALTAARVHVGIISVVEYTMDIPENQNRRNLDPTEAAFQDRRSRGLGGLPLATCAEENLLNLRSDPYAAENITIHEFSHTVASAIRFATPAWYQKLRDTYAQAMKEGLFAHSYSATNEQEYWAEGAQAWFDCAAQRKDPSVHSGIWNRDQLKAYDPRLAALLAEVYGDGAWRYVKSTNLPLRVANQTFTRPPADLLHLAGLNRDHFPTFSFENSPRIRAAATLPATSP
ncbi:MAG TPA: hypothetical protein VH253_18320 [Phycisphaerae bacterium]|nr:hypothetical protein [Phycisphaerae bacterium]